MRTIKEIRNGVECTITVQTHEDIAKSIEGNYDGYKIKCYSWDNSFTIYELSGHYFRDRRKKLIGKLYFDINTDTVFYKQYGYKEIQEGIGIYKKILKHLRDNDVIIIKGKTSSKTQIKMRVKSLKEVEQIYLANNNKYVYIPRNFGEVKFN